MIGIGVIGNVAGHLHQSGEKGFGKKQSPKGLFPFFVPKNDSFLSTYPISNTSIRLPKEKSNVQPEPELALICKVAYKDNKVKDLTPVKCGAFNDATIRRKGTGKISKRKNWGRCSKGISKTFLNIDKFEKGGCLDHYKIASYIKRKGNIHSYGKQTVLSRYLYFYNTLMKWMVKTINNQKNKGLLEPMLPHFESAGFPRYALIAIGATAYTRYGQKHYLKPGDEVSIVVFDSRKHKSALKLLQGNHHKNVSLLKQKVISS